MGNFFKEDIGPECSLVVKGVVYEAGCGLILLRMRPVGIPFKEDTGPECSLGINGVVYVSGGSNDLAEKGTSGESL